MATKYHGRHDYSTFSASTISTWKLEDGGGEEINRNKPFCFFVFHPVGPFKCIWDMFVMCLILYTSIEIPYSMSFGQLAILQSIGLFVDGFLLIDIIINFHTAYFDKYDNLRLVTNKRYICKKYFCGWFWIDFVTCIPFELMFQDSTQHQNGSNDTQSNAFTYFKLLRIFRLLRIVKILRFIKMLRIFDAFMKQFMFRELIILMKVAKIIFGMLLFAHFAACLWWFVGTKTEPSWIDKQGLRDDHISLFTKYSYSFYWAVITLFTTGYGDITATNTVEQWVCSIAVLIGTVFFAYFIGTLTALITEGDKIKSYELEKLEEAQSFCEKKKLPKELTRAILTHIRYYCNYNYIFDEADLLTMLPSYLQHDIHAYVSKQFLSKLKIFRNEFIQLPDFIIGLIAVNTKSISCNQSYNLYDIGDIAKEFYIQRTGKSTLRDKNNAILHQLSRGSVCGEYSSFLFKKRKLKIECETWSEFYSISIVDIKNILYRYYPKSATAKWKLIQKYVKYAYNCDSKHHVELNNYIYNGNFEENPSSINSTTHRSSAIMRRNSSIRSKHLFDNTRKATIINVPLPPPPPSPSPHRSEADENNIKTRRKVSILNKMRSKIMMRSDSGARDAVVITHSDKHNKLSTPRFSSTQQLQRSSRIQTTPSVSKNKLPPTKMHQIQTNSTNNTCLGDELKKKSSSIRSRSQYSGLSTINGSECSFSSISSDICDELASSFDDDMEDNELLRACTDSKQENNFRSATKKKRNTKKKRIKCKFNVPQARNATNGSRFSAMTPGPDETHESDHDYDHRKLAKMLSSASVLLAALHSSGAGKEDVKNGLQVNKYNVDNDGDVDDKPNQNVFLVSSNYDDNLAEIYETSNDEIQPILPIAENDLQQNENIS